LKPPRWKQRSVCVRNILTVASLATLTVLGAVHQMNRPQDLALCIAAAVVATASKGFSRRQRLSGSALGAVAAFLFVSSAELAVPLPTTFLAARIAFKPAAILVVMLGVLALRESSFNSSFADQAWFHAVLTASLTAVVALGAGFLYISHYHALEARVACEATINIALILAAFLLARTALAGGYGTAAHIYILYSAYVLLAANLGGHFF